MTKPLHKFTSKVVKRNATRKASKWGGLCSCGEMYIGGSYESVEDQWRKHRWELNGHVPEPRGRQTHRWKPPAPEKPVAVS